MFPFSSSTSTSTHDQRLIQSIVAVGALVGVFVGELIPDLEAADIDMGAYDEDAYPTSAADKYAYPPGFDIDALSGASDNYCRHTRR